MATVNAAQASIKTVADPNAAYLSIASVWERNRAVCNGERFVKDYDDAIDYNTFLNILIPFSPSMTLKQYLFYKAEAELPGITAQFSRMLVGGLLRKTPTVKFPDDTDESVKDWIVNEFGKDDSTLTSFLDAALWEEMQTSRAWIFVDYPKVDESAVLTQEDKLLYKPYPCLYKAEAIINWRVQEDDYGRSILDRIIVRGYEEDFTKSEFHPTFKVTVWVHDLDEMGGYRIRKYQRRDDSSNVSVVTGQQQAPQNEKTIFDLIDQNSNILINGERLDFIPAWPLNGSVEVVTPVLSPIIDKEVALYNKISRRNHLLYGAATYTPYICSDMTDESFQEIVNAGLGSWFKLQQGDSANVLETPTAALADMDRAIVTSIEEMAKLGIRMLTPETDQSGVALELRNAAQTAQLGSLNNKISHTFQQVIALMVNWRMGTDIKASDVTFSLSADFQPVPLGSDWLRLATEWYQQALIPRSIWLLLLKYNDIVPPDYDDEAGREEITNDMDMAAQSQNDAYAQQTQIDVKAQNDQSTVQAELDKEKLKAATIGKGKINGKT